MDKFYARILRVFWWCAVAFVVVAGTIFCAPKFNRGESICRKREEIAKRISAKRAEIAKLREYRERFAKDRSFVEFVARKTRRVFPGETVFVFED